MKKNLRRGLSLLLIAVLVALLLVPVLQRQQLLPDNPIADAQIRDIDIFRGGQDSGGGSSPDRNEGGSDGSQPSEPAEEPTEQPTQAPDLSDTDVETRPGTDSNGQEGQEDGQQGEQGGQTVLPGLAAVLYWYPYGTQEQTVVCSPMETVGKGILTAQLPGNQLQYRIRLTGPDAEGAKITAVTLQAGDALPKPAETDGSFPVEIPVDPGFQNYIVQVRARADLQDRQGTPVTREVEFTFVLRCENGKDLSLTLQWQQKEGNAQVTCRADGFAAKSVNGALLPRGKFQYTLSLSGALAAGSKILSAEYTAPDGEKVSLDPESGTLPVALSPSGEPQNYDLLCTVQTGNGDQCTYRIRLSYRHDLDLNLNFTWFQQGITPRSRICRPGQTVTAAVKTNQLSAGALPYEITLTGESAADARIRAISCRAQDGGTDRLEPIGSLPIRLLPDEDALDLTLTVTVQVGADKAVFTVLVRCTRDAVLQLHFTTTENGAATEKRVSCENGKSVTAQLIFDDQLRDSQLPYRFSFRGGADLQIVSIRLYQSGSGKSLSVPPEGSVQLLLEQGLTGENTFTVTAEDASGLPYTFRISIPYKHRGKNLVKITTNFADGATVTNGTPVNLEVRAWVEDEKGNVLSHILATGTNGSKITVKLDGEEIPYVSASGPVQEYTLLPRDPDTGDTNTHRLQIYAEDRYGNFGNYAITLKGRRNQSGQELGHAQVYIDMTVLGLGLSGPVPYTVLSREPIANVVPKVVWGQDTGIPFGHAEHTFGWVGGQMGGTPEKGFYLKSMTPGGGMEPQALHGISWDSFGDSPEAICACIDEKFGAGTGLATLWRCIYRNGLNLSTETPGQIGEFDFTSGSGWVYAVNGHYPGQSMSDYYLQDGDVLTLRYTLAQGWDVGTGTDGYGSSVGYCVSAANGAFSIRHRWEQVTTPDGRTVQRCQCCGLEAECPHTHTEYRDLGDGTHVLYCKDCRSDIGAPEAHAYTEYTDRENPETHSMVCSVCGSTLREPHSWQELSNTATCTEAGIRTVYCPVCGITLELPVPPRGHQTDNLYVYDAAGHWQICEVCGEKLSVGAHSWVYLEEEDDWECSVCHALHGWNLNHFLDDSSLVPEKCTCLCLVYRCPHCGQEFTRPGSFSAYHHYENGICIHCGARDPDAIAPPPDKPEAADRMPEHGGKNYE